MLNKQVLFVDNTTFDSKMYMTLFYGLSDYTKTGGVRV